MYDKTYQRILSEPKRDRSIKDFIYLYCFDALLNGGTEDELYTIRKDLSKLLGIGMFTINVYCNQAIIDFNKEDE